MPPHERTADATQIGDSTPDQRNHIHQPEALGYRVTPDLAA